MMNRSCSCRIKEPLNRLASPGEGGLDVAVCVVTFHSDPGMLDDCLNSIVDAALHAGLTAEIVVVNNGGSVEIPTSISDAGAVAVRVVHSSSNVGFGSAVNLALRSARAPIALLLNPDAALDQCALAELTRHYTEASGMGIFSALLLHNQKPQVDAFHHWWFSAERLVRRRIMIRTLSRCRNEVLPVKKVCGGALLASRELLVGLGPFDEDFFLYGEDADLSLRARATGVRLHACLNAVVRHQAASSQKSHSQLVERARTDAAIRLSAKHGSWLFSMAVRVELLLTTVIGLVLGGRSSGNKTTRISRFKEIGRWGTHRYVSRFQP